jgi:ribosome-binding protein aMBF1 (putative translation factor)
LSCATKVSAKWEATSRNPLGKLERNRAGMKIENERDYRITGAWLRRFERDLEQLSQKPLGKASATLRKAQSEAMASQIEDLKVQMREYEAVKQRKKTSVPVYSLEDLPDALIQARIASGLTQQGLAAKLGLKKQQIQRYETTRYQTASLQRLSEVAAVLSVKIKAEILFS